jgi:hypothetical protein
MLYLPMSTTFICRSPPPVGALITGLHVGRGDVGGEHGRLAALCEGGGGPQCEQDADDAESDTLHFFITHFCRQPPDGL